MQQIGFRIETNKSERSVFGSSFLIMRSGYVTVELVDGRMRDVRSKTKCGRRG